MDKLVCDILDALRASGPLDAAALDKIIRAHSKRAGDGRRVFAKKHVLAYYLETRREQGEKWRSWNVDDELDERFMATMKMKPRRTASGVATITVITKPWGCAGTCIYCPCDVRMPKSYLHDEPACQRAERNWFDPYLQVAARLASLQNMGHATDKVELIVLGGTWDDYPHDYRLWFATQLFEALNENDRERALTVKARRFAYRQAGIHNFPSALASQVANVQERVDAGELTFNEACDRLYRYSTSWQKVEALQHASLDDLERAQHANEQAAHRVVGLVVETRPDKVSAESLAELRRLGCTKIQMGVQSLDEEILGRNGRMAGPDVVARALSLARLFGFKTHVHFMLNLLGATPEHDKRDYELLVSDERFRPDEVKLYPCALVAGTRLVAEYEEGRWRPYTEEELVDVLSHDMMITPPYLRVSRMIRDISAKDILVGNKKTNLRQIVDEKLAAEGAHVQEVRFREIGTADVSISSLALDEVEYETESTLERFLQWVDERGRIAGFLRLSLPHEDVLAELEGMPEQLGCAMIREVHVYGFAAQLSQEGTSAQHHGLGRALVERACELARDEGFDAVNVISAVGTREYYRKLGFVDNGLYQTKRL